MSEPELPEDLDRWPSNPYELLRVEYGVSPRDLHRAYTRLIRTYKPEQYPEHFRRIREAYESLLRHAEMYSGWADALEPDDRSTQSDEPAEAPPAPRPSQAPESTPRSGRAANLARTKRSALGAGLFGTGSDGLRAADRSASPASRPGRHLRAALLAAGVDSGDRRPARAVRLAGGGPAPDRAERASAELYRRNCASIPRTP